MIGLLGKKNSEKTSLKSPRQTDEERGNEDRYNPGLKLFNDVRARETISRKNWQLFAYLCLGLNALTLFGAISAFHQPTLVPYVVKVDNLGQIVTIGIPSKLDPNSQLTQVAAQYQLRQFIQASRGVVYDADFEGKLLKEYVRPFIQPQSQANKTIEDFFKLNDPFKFALERKSTVEINVDEPIPQTATTFALHWTESIKDSAGGLSSKTDWKGFATIELHDVTSEQLRLNPLGMYISQLTWQPVGGDTAANGVR